MCYDIKASLEAQLKRAKRRGDMEAVRQIKEKLVPLTDLPLHHASGFDHPRLLIYPDSDPEFPMVATWGLIPHWVRDQAQKKNLWNSTLNARGETIFEKPSFRDAARDHRCVIYIDGFYEHYHLGGKTFPYFIYHKEGNPLILAGLWSEWEDPSNGEWIRSFTIVTTSGNALLSRIHNNPKIQGPRMPLILHDALVEDWLLPATDRLDEQRLKDMMMPYPDSELEAHTVRRLRGKSYPGNIPSITDEFVYPELAQQSLF